MFLPLLQNTFICLYQSNSSLLKFRKNTFTPNKQTNLGLLQKIQNWDILHKKICTNLAPSVSLAYHFNHSMAYIRLHLKNQPHDSHSTLPQTHPEQDKRILPCLLFTCICIFHIVRVAWGRSVHIDTETEWQVDEVSWTCKQILFT